VKRLRAPLTACLVLAVAAASAAEAPRERAVVPGETFGGAALRVHPPGGDGWLVRETATEIVFGRPGASERESVVASVSFFELPDGLDAGAFTSFIRRMTEQEMPPERFADATFATTTEKQRGCVRVEASATDLNAPGGPLAQAMHALYCRYTLRAGFGFAALYSQRAASIDADLAQQAQAFFDGVSVPED
jgi:hypothetical protein